MPNELFGQGRGRREGIVAEECDDLGHGTNPKLCDPRFPVMDGRFIHAELLSHLGLEQAEIEPASAKVVAYRNELSWIGLREWLGRFEAQMATKQRNAALMGGSPIPIGGAGAVPRRFNATSREFPGPYSIGLIFTWTYPQCPLTR